jgi:hypothetical protein
MFLHLPKVMVRGYLESISCDIAFTTEGEAFKMEMFLKVKFSCKWN